MRTLSLFETDSVAGGDDPGSSGYAAPSSIFFEGTAAIATGGLTGALIGVGSGAAIGGGSVMAAPVLVVGAACTTAAATGYLVGSLIYDVLGGTRYVDPHPNMPDASYGGPVPF